MQLDRGKKNVAKTAYLTAWVRSLGRLIGGEAANADDLAECFLLPENRLLNRAPRLARWLIERVSPGAFGYFNARTRYFDQVLLSELGAGLDQLVLLGAGFDSRPQRFAAQLQGVRVFEVDMPEVLSIRRERLAHVVSPRVDSSAVPIDFEREQLAQRLVQCGYRASTGRTLFLWEGVTYYLAPEAVSAVLRALAELSTAGSSIVFDYVTQAFFAGDHASHGAQQLALGWRRMGNVNRSGVADVAALLARHGFRLREEITPELLEQRYLKELPGPLAKPWGMMRIAHATRS